MLEKNKTVAILMTASDYAKRHNVSRVAVNNMIKEKRVNAVLCGSMYLIQDTLRLK